MSKKKPLQKYNETFSEYKSLFKILQKRKIRKNDFYKHNQKQVIDTAHIIAHKIHSFLKFKKIKNNYKFMDIGCGLGQITNEIGKINGYDNTYACEPSIYAAKFVKKLYSKIKFINGGIERINNKYNNFFDVLYLKEVSPFRSSNLNLQKKLVNRMIDMINEEGVIVFEQIRNKGKIDIYKNIKKLNFNHYITPTIPNSILRSKKLRNYLLKNYKILNIILKIFDNLYFRYLRQKTYYIVVFKD